MRRARFGSLAALAFGAALVAAPAGAQAPSSAPPCDGTTVGKAVALQLDGNAPIVVGSGGGVARYEPIVTSTGQPGPVKPPHLFCAGIANVVGVAVYLGTLSIADASTVHVLSADTGKPLGTFSPALAPNETIAAIALLPSGAVELAIVPRASAPSKPLRARFAVFAASARGTAPAPLRSFAYDGFLAPPSAIATDSKGRTYAYDFGGEILLFGAGATGAVEPERRFAGTESALRPAARGKDRGSRPLALDLLGSLLAADDGAIVRFAFTYDGQYAKGEPLEIDPSSRLGIVRGIATDNALNQYVLCIDPTTGRATIRIFDEAGNAQGTTVPIP